MATEVQVRLYREGDEEAVVALWIRVFPPIRHPGMSPNS
jgi:hypothetical protein